MVNGLDDRQLGLWRDYLRVLADLLGLRDWQIDASRRFVDDALACCDVTFGRKEAVISLSAAFLECGLSEQRHLCVHELLHCHFDPIHDAVWIAFKDDEDPRIRLFCDYHRRARELTLDGVAVAIAEFLPLPEVDRGA